MTTAAMSSSAPAAHSTVDRAAMLRIYREYFDLIDSYFGSMTRYLGSSGDSHLRLGPRIAAYPLISDLIVDATSDLHSTIHSFWKEHSSVLFEYVRQQSTLKCIHSGDLSPVVLEEFVKKSALYIDTSIVADPLYTISVFQTQPNVDHKELLSKFIRHVFNIWRVKDLILADTAQDILLVLPTSLMILPESTRMELASAGGERCVSYINQLTSKAFGSSNEVFVFFEGLNTKEEVFSQMVCKDVLPQSLREMSSLDAFLTRFRSQRLLQGNDAHSIGWSLCMYLHTQFIRVQEHNYFCEQLVAEPLYDYDLPWFFHTYDLGGHGLDASIANALQTERFEWLTKLPLGVLKTFREEDTLDYMRATLRRGLTDLKARMDVDLTNVSSQLEENLRAAFRQQTAELEALKRKAYRLAGIELPLTVAGVLAAFVPVVDTVFSLFTAGRDIKKHLVEHRMAQQALKDKKRNIINLLMVTKDE